MKRLGDVFHCSDWKLEKHMPVIELSRDTGSVAAYLATVCVGKEMPHPNTTEHHIQYISLYFLPDGEKYPCHLGHFEAYAHGASAQGPNTSDIRTDPKVMVSFATEKQGMLFAVSFCNVHGLWESSAVLK